MYECVGEDKRFHRSFNLCEIKAHRFLFEWSQLVTGSYCL